MKGMVNSVPREICLDTGAKMCVMPSSWCSDSDVTGKKVDIRGVGGTVKEADTVHVTVDIFNMSIPCEVALVDEQSVDRLLLGQTVGVDRLTDLIFENRHVRKKSKLRHVGVTRAQSKHRQEVERRGDMLDEQDGAVPVMDDPTSDTHPVHTESDIDDLGSSEKTLFLLQQYLQAKM